MSHDPRPNGLDVVTSGQGAGDSSLGFLFWGEKCWEILLMEEIQRKNQLRLVVYPICLQGFLHPRWCKISSINSIWGDFCVVTENGCKAHRFFFWNGTDVVTKMGDR